MIDLFLIQYYSYVNGNTASILGGLQFANIKFILYNSGKKERKNHLLQLLSAEINFNSDFNITKPT